MSSKFDHDWFTGAFVDDALGGGGGGGVCVCVYVCVRVRACVCAWGGGGGGGDGVHTQKENLPLNHQ